MASILRAYNSALARRPFVTQCASAAVLFGAGDVLAQQAIEKKGKKHDIIRTTRLAFYGGAIFAPILSQWFLVLDRIKFASKPVAILTKVGLDQFVAAPVMVGLFFSSMTVLEGKGTDEIQRRLQNAWQPTLVKNWGVFIPTQIINFSIVPPPLRLLTINVVSLFWNCYLSYANSQTQPAVPAIEKVKTSLKA